MCIQLTSSSKDKERVTVTTMVAPHDNGELVRSLVRIPGSGSGRKSGAEYLNLARVSSLAATVNVPSTLPSTLTTRRVADADASSSSPPPPPQPTKKLENATTQSSIGIIHQSTVDVVSRPAVVSVTIQQPSGSGYRKRQFSAVFSGSSSSSAGTVPTNAKKPRTSQEDIKNHDVNSLPKPMILLLLLSKTQQPEAAPRNLEQYSLAELIKECDALKRENQELLKRISLFQQLFKDKQRLKDVVERLGINVQ